MGAYQSISITPSSALNLDKQRSQRLRNGRSPPTRRLQALYGLGSPRSSSPSKKSFAFERVQTSASSTGGALQKPEATNASCRPRVCPSLPLWLSSCPLQREHRLSRQLWANMEAGFQRSGLTAGTKRQKESGWHFEPSRLAWRDTERKCHLRR